MELSILRIFLFSILALVGAYILIRLISKATFRSYFETKKQYENQDKQKGKGGKNASLRS